MKFTVEAQIEDWPIEGSFVISRGAKSTATLVVASVTAGGVCGRGECAPYPRYGETPQQVRSDISAQASVVNGSPDVSQARERINAVMPPGAARNALDCALWDLQAKICGEPVWRLAGLPPPCPVVTAFTISLGSPREMGLAAHDAAARPLLKLKLGGDDAGRLASVRAAAPAARLIVDANEAWTAQSWPGNLAACMRAGVELIEQPFPAVDDAALASLERPIPVCADESAQDAPSIRALAGRYDAVNIKLDKTGGLTGAIRAIDAARTCDLRVMLGCMVGTSLSMAPAMLLAPQRTLSIWTGHCCCVRTAGPACCIRVRWRIRRRRACGVRRNYDKKWRLPDYIKAYTKLVMAVPCR